MPSPEEKAKRSAIKRTLREEQRERYRSSLPLEPSVIRELFDFLDQSLEKHECDNTLKNALSFLSERKLDRQPVISWLEGHGGFCDCEVLANVEEEFLETFPEV